MTAAAVIPVLDSWAGRAQVHRYFVCDVFTSRPLAGNQLGVFADGRAFSPDEMQRLARELNYAETVFLLPPENGGDVRVRIFTPQPPGAAVRRPPCPRHGLRRRFGQQITVRQGEEIGRPFLLYATARGQSPDRIESAEVGGAAMIVASGQFRIAID